MSFDKDMREKIRINKYLSASGVMSRREADRFIMSGRITVNGENAVEGMKVDGSEEIRIDGVLLDKNPESEKKVILCYYKKRGIVTSTVNQGREKNNIVDVINYPVRVYPIGRLDKESEGLILLTNDGSVVNKLLKPGKKIEKEYELSLDKDIPDNDIKKMARGGIELLPGRRNKPFKIVRIDNCHLRVTLTEGMNREIRRAAEYYGYRVMKLKRIRFGNIKLDSLKPGEYRELTEDEIKRLMK
ncbi:MAG: rRNA pseudouridine synthase [Lachnospiraceae bacterium]|nr:rRNA pseudouridine synthase [Lachnospiraceae bacterium]